MLDKNVYQSAATLPSSGGQRTRALYRSRGVAAFVALLCLVAATGALCAQEAADDQSSEPPQGWFFGLGAVGLANIEDGPRAGLQGRVWYQHPLFHRTGSLWDPARIEVGLANRWTPVSNEVTASVYFEPIAVFDVTASVTFQTQYDQLLDATGYYRLTSYDEDPTDEIDERYTTQSGLVYRVAPRVKAAFAGFIAAHTVQISYVDYGAVSDDSDDFDYYLDAPAGISEVLNERDMWIRNNTVVLYQVTDELNLGLNSVADTVPDADRTNYRLSLIGLYDRPLRNDWNLGLVVVTGAYLSHRWLEGEPDLTVVVEFSRPLR